MSSNLWVLCHYIVGNVKLCWQLWFVIDICKIPEKQRTSYKTFLKIDRKHFYITCLWGMEIHITSTVRTTVWRQWNDVNIQWFMQMYEIKYTHFPSVYCQHILFFNLSVFFIRIPRWMTTDQQCSSFVALVPLIKGKQTQ